MSLENTNIFTLEALTGKDTLTTLALAGNYKVADFQPVYALTGLRYTDFSGNLHGTGFSGFDYKIEVYGDVSLVFSCPNWEALYFDNGLFEINFDRIKDNPSLKVLGLRNLGLHKFPNLQELYLDSNSLTDISFVTGLPMLTLFSIKDNYVTDLTPLVPSEHLTYLNVMDNSLSTLENMRRGLPLYSK